MNWIICGKSNEKSVCSDCENKKRCKVCNILKTDIYTTLYGKKSIIILLSIAAQILYGSSELLSMSNTATEQ